MDWDFATTTTQVARKEYNCDASDWLLNAGLDSEDWTDVEREQISKAKKEGWKILKGTEYTKTEGMWEGDFTVYRARPELQKILDKYDMCVY